MENHSNGCHVYELIGERWQKMMVWPTEAEARAGVLRTVSAADQRALVLGEEVVAPEKAKKARRRKRT